MTETTSARRVWNGKSNSRDSRSWRTATLAQTDLTAQRSCKGSRNVTELSGEETHKAEKGYDYFPAVLRSIKR